MLKLFNVKMTYYKKKHTLHIFSIRIADFLSQLGKYKSREWRIPQVIKDSSKKYKLEWIKAFCEDEAYLPKKRNIVRIKSMNFSGIKDIKQLLDSIKIESWITGKNCDDSWYLNIRKMKEMSTFSKKPARK